MQNFGDSVIFSPAKMWLKDLKINNEKKTAKNMY